jgi:hypothetical protein
MPASSIPALPLSHDFSNLAATILKQQPLPRPNSVIANNLARHPPPDGLFKVDEFEHLDFSLAPQDWAGSVSQTMSDILPAVYFHTCLANPINFAVSTNVECFRADESREGELLLSPSFSRLRAKSRVQNGYHWTMRGFCHSWTP